MLKFVHVEVGTEQDLTRLVIMLFAATDPQQPDGVSLTIVVGAHQSVLPKRLA